MKVKRGPEWIERIGWAYDRALSDSSGNTVTTPVVYYPWRKVTRLRIKLHVRAFCQIPPFDLILKSLGDGWSISQKDQSTLILEGTVNGQIQDFDSRLHAIRRRLPGKLEKNTG